MKKDIYHDREIDVSYNGKIFLNYRVMIKKIDVLHKTAQMMIIIKLFPIC